MGSKQHYVTLRLIKQVLIDRQEKGNEYRGGDEQVHFYI
jgi:hypothetical protein